MPRSNESFFTPRDVREAAAQRLKELKAQMETCQKNVRDMDASLRHARRILSNLEERVAETQAFLDRAIPYDRSSESDAPQG